MVDIHKYQTLENGQFIYIIDEVYVFAYSEEYEEEEDVLWLFDDRKNVVANIKGGRVKE